MTKLAGNCGAVDLGYASVHKLSPIGSTARLRPRSRRWGMADAASGYLLAWEYFLGSDGLPDKLRISGRGMSGWYSGSGQVNLLS